MNGGWSYAGSLAALPGLQATTPARVEPGVSTVMGESDPTLGEDGGPLSAAAGLEGARDPSMPASCVSARAGVHVCSTE